MAEVETTEAPTAVEEKPTTEEPKGTPESSEDWKAFARKHEREAKKVRKENEDLQARLAGIENETKTEQEKAIEKARAEAKAEVQAEVEKARRSDRLEMAVTRLAAKSFADTEDALLHVQRGIDAGDLDSDEFFADDGQVQTKALTKALEDILERKPYLSAAPNGVRPRGDADAGKGSAAPVDDDNPKAALGRGLLQAIAEQRGH